MTCIGGVWVASHPRMVYTRDNTVMTEDCFKVRNTLRNTASEEEDARSRGPTDYWAYYQFEADFNDSSSGTHHATIAAGTWDFSATNPKGGSALHKVNTDRGYLNTPAGFYCGNNYRSTVTFWIKMPDSRSLVWLCDSSGYSGNGKMLYHNTSGNNWACSYNYGPTATFPLGTSITGFFGANTWVFVALRMDYDRSKGGWVYQTWYSKTGVLYTGRNVTPYPYWTNGYNSNMTTSGTIVYVGGYRYNYVNQSGASCALNQDFWHMRFYQRALSTAEVTAIYDEEKA